MNIAIVEDIDSDYNNLENILQNNDICKKLSVHITRYKSAEHLLAGFHKDKFQLLFLDMLLAGDMTGMEAAREIRRIAPEVPLVFTTCEGSYALAGYEVQIMDYLLKPCSPERIDSVLQRIFATGIVKAYLSVQVNRETVRFPLSDLMWASYREHAVEIYLCGHKRLRTYMRFSDFCDLLPEKTDFYCCCRGVIVNLDYVDYINNGDFILTDGHSIPISRAKRAQLQAAFNEFSIRKTRGGLK